MFEFMTKSSVFFVYLRKDFQRYVNQQHTGSFSFKNNILIADKSMKLITKQLIINLPNH